MGESICIGQRDRSVLEETQAYPVQGFQTDVYFAGFARKQCEDADVHQHQSGRQQLPRDDDIAQVCTEGKECRAGSVKEECASNFVKIVDVRVKLLVCLYTLKK